MKPRTRPAGLNWTDEMWPTGMRFSPFPIVARARKPERTILTKAPSNVMVPLTPLTSSDM
ncbi:MAG: hypothetical protein JWP64_1055 [Pseudonocardia sp.]|nr:hypothetical protein [Pseudonocardia sp.]MDT7618466.1 hypothetical protein [Pseudonocardiales bacterium]